MTTVALLGAGGIADLHLPALLALGLDVVVFSGSESAHRLVDKHGGGRVGDTLADAFANSDIVDICTPTSTHRGLAIQGAELGKHIICEKPLALTLEDAAAMRDTCARNGVMLFPAHVVRFFPAYAAAQQAVSEGTLGTIIDQEFSRTVASPTMEWFWDPALSGGIATELMIHDLDFARWCAGEVSTVVAEQIGTGTPGSSTTVRATLTHTSGVVSHIAGTCGTAAASFGTLFDVTGTLGHLEHDSSASRPAGQLIDPYRAQLEEFVEAALSGTPARVTADDGIAAVELALAVNQALALGEPVAPGQAHAS